MLQNFSVTSMQHFFDICAWESCWLAKIMRQIEYEHVNYGANKNVFCVTQILTNCAFSPLTWTNSLWMFVQIKCYLPNLCWVCTVALVDQDVSTVYSHPSQQGLEDTIGSKVCFTLQKNILVFKYFLMHWWAAFMKRSCIQK